MNENRARKIFVFDMADFNNMQFLDSNGNLQKDFTSNCIFYNSKEANSISEKASKKYPNSNFQLDLVPSSVCFLPCKNEEFWDLFRVKQNEYYKRIKNG